MECVIETKASIILHLVERPRGDLRVTFEEGTWAAWLYELLKPHVTEVVQSDRIDGRKLAEQLYTNTIKSVYYGEHTLRTLKELARSYLAITQDLAYVMNEFKALYRSWAIPYAGNEG